MPVSNYQKEQVESLTCVRAHFSSLNPKDREQLLEMGEDYFSFRKRVNHFLNEFFSETCRLKCYQSNLSACCSKEGIITFFADIVLNALLSTDQQLDRLEGVLKRDNTGHKCVYLGKKGCLWALKPIVCEMFLCEHAKKDVFRERNDLRLQWEEFRRREKLFKWPDRPVLFDKLEKIFLEAGYNTPLMYLHNSPGLIRVKRCAGLL